MALVGTFTLLIAFVGLLASLACLGAGHLASKKQGGERAETLAWTGHIALIVAFAALTASCAVLAFCFFTGDYSIQYVLDQHSNSASAFASLYTLAGLWAGRQGSLLFWAWLISLFALIVALKDIKKLDGLDCGALAVMDLVLVSFVALLLFSQDNLPFVATSAAYYSSDGSLSAAAAITGMNPLLEHWAMAIHPPLLFVGYAGLTVPFAYAVSALVCGDASSQWIARSQRCTMVSWSFLGVGIGLGAVWAYVVLGWGGYWGWDPVENASLLPWLAGVALIHSATVCRKNGGFKRWTIMCACITFAFVIVGTFISRSGLVQSVHAFEGDLISLVLFLGLIVFALAVGAIGLFLRNDLFSVEQPQGKQPEGKPEQGKPEQGKPDGEEDEGFFTKGMAYYFNNLIVILMAVILAYLTIAQALPEPLPFAGQSISAGTYNAIFRPVSILYLALLAICPLLSWGKTDPKRLLSRIKVPGICAAVLFAGLLAFFLANLLPAYQANIAAGGTEAEGLLSEGPSWYYNGLAIAGFAVASFLFFNALAMLVNVVRKGRNLKAKLSALGGSVAHMGMAVILVGLIGSSMYVTQHGAYVDYDSKADAAEAFAIGDYELRYVSNSIESTDNDTSITYSVTFDAYKGGSLIGTVNPSVQVVRNTQQQKLNASVISLPTEDLFVVYEGVNDDGDFYLDVRINPLVSVVWLGFGILVLGGIIAMFARRTGRVAQSCAVQSFDGDRLDVMEGKSETRG